MSNKTISINPNLFSLTGSKTKKQKDKQPKKTPLISPNILKNKLLKRIKEHKQQETQNQPNNQKKLTPSSTEQSSNFEKDMIKFNDEFFESLNYLQTLSKQQKINSEKNTLDEIKNKRRAELERKTIKHYSPLSTNINLDLPEELIQQPITQTGTPLQLTPIKKVADDVPYGVLKGGLKPSYREWSKTQRNNIVTNPNNSLVIAGGINHIQTARENRLNLLRQKLKAKEEQTDIFLNNNLIKHAQPPLTIQSQPPIQQPLTIQSQPPIQQPLTIQSQPPIQPQTGGKVIATKHITKKTIKRKYTLGKSNSKSTVGILLKDRGTRKQILNAQKELKRKNINEIKTYLKEHNLIKIGNNTPNDVLRKMYESAMLSGEITNNNKDILMHNLSKEDKEL